MRFKFSKILAVSVLGGILSVPAFATALPDITSGGGLAVTVRIKYKAYYALQTSTQQTYDHRVLCTAGFVTDRNGVPGVLTAGRCLPFDTLASVDFSKTNVTNSLLRTWINEAVPEPGTTAATHIPRLKHLLTIASTPDDKIISSQITGIEYVPPQEGAAQPVPVSLYTWSSTVTPPTNVIRRKFGDAADGDNIAWIKLPTTFPKNQTQFQFYRDEPQALNDEVLNRKVEEPLNGVTTEISDGQVFCFYGTVSQWQCGLVDDAWYGQMHSGGQAEIFPGQAGSRQVLIYGDAGNLTINRDDGGAPVVRVTFNDNNVSYDAAGIVSSGLHVDGHPDLGPIGGFDQTSTAQTGVLVQPVSELNTVFSDGGSYSIGVNDSSCSL